MKNSTQVSSASSTIEMNIRVHHCTAQNFGSALGKLLVIGQFIFSSVFLCFSLVTIDRQIPHDPGFLPIVVLLFFVDGKQGSCRDGHLTKQHLSWAG